MALAIGYPITCSDWWGPMAEQLLTAEGAYYSHTRVDASVAGLSLANISSIIRQWWRSLVFASIRLAV